jgi:hypothetical protein
MKLVDLLRKLGIMRYGVKTGTYTGMQDRPAEFFMDDVYNAHKDLVNRDDVRGAAVMVQSLDGRKVLYWAASVLGFLILLLFAAGTGLTVWFGVALLLWGGFIAVVRQFALEGRYSSAMMILLLVVLVFVSLMLLGAAVSK